MARLLKRWVACVGVQSGVPVLPAASDWRLTALACLQDDILMFGGNGGRETRPEYVTDAWAIAAEFLTEDKGVVCACSR